MVSQYYRIIIIIVQSECNTLLHRAAIFKEL